MSPDEVQRHVDAIEAAVRQSAEQITRFFGPAWQARSDLAKIVITISAGLVAALLAFSEESFLQLSRFQFSVAIGCLIGLLAAVTSAIASLYAATELSSFQARQFNRRPYLRAELSKLDQDSRELESKIEALWRPLLEEDTGKLGGASERAEIFLKLAVGLFVGSLVGFVGLLAMQYCGA